MLDYEQRGWCGRSFEGWAKLSAPIGHQSRVPDESRVSSRRLGLSLLWGLDRFLDLLLYSRP